MRRLIFVLIILWSLHVYIGYQLLHTSAISSSIMFIGTSILSFSALLIPFSIAIRFMGFKPSFSDILSWIGMIDLALFSSLLVLTFLRHMGLLAYGLYYPISNDLSLKTSTLVLILTIVTTLIGFIEARRTARVKKVTIPIDKLADELAGIKIVQLTDIHVGPTIKHNYLKSIVDKVNSLGADIIVITGDLVDGTVAQLSQHVEVLSKLNSKHGTFFVLGNHEYYSGASDWIIKLRQLGLRVLLNEHVTITHNNANLVIAGITDYSGVKFGPEHRSDPKLAVANAPTNTTKILLAHQPRSAIEACKYDFALQISGHTHGGQFWPWNLFVRLQQPFTAGLAKMEDMWVYTSRGTGYWGPPNRLGSPSEISMLYLIRA